MDNLPRNDATLPAVTTLIVPPNELGSEVSHESVAEVSNESNVYNTAVSLSKDGESSLSSDLVHHATDLLGSPEVPSQSTLDPSPEVPVFSNQLVHRKPCLVRERIAPSMWRQHMTLHAQGFFPGAVPCRLLASGTKFIHLPSLSRPGSKFTSSFSSVKMSFG